MKVKEELENIVLMMFFQFRNPQRLHAERRIVFDEDIVRTLQRCKD